jgi:serine/threonine protein kinase
MSFDASQAAYKKLRSIVAERTSGLVAWVGAGASAPAGIPTWAGLKKHLLGILQEKIGFLEDSDKDKQKIVSMYEQISKDADYWRSFERLRSALGQTTYRDEIRAALVPATTASVPEIYKQLWRLPLHGMLTLNLDRLAERSYVSVYGDSSSPVTFTGEQAKRLYSVLNSGHRFVGNLHGVHEDSSSWVLTKGELSRLIQDEDYKTFVKSILATKTIVFVGITADDVAVGGFLEALSKNNIQTGTHYWITSRTDSQTDRWAESVGIRTIRYDSRSKHGELNELFEDLCGYKSFDDDSELRPVRLETELEKKVENVEPADLVAMSAEDIREILNRKAQDILAANTEGAYKEYERFCEKYDEAIYRAWYTSDKAPNNKLIGYTLNRLEATGAFGKVYSATASDGRTVAVKVLLEDVRRNPDSLKSFRRGVRSMRILQENKVHGMVVYENASEIPAFVVMEWVDGPNLSTAVKARFISEWEDILKVSTKLARIILDAHQLPERVLHRDLRPSNVMLKNYFTDPDCWDVVVLDFDLSWHKGAVEKSVLHTAAFGYLAPEQMMRVPGSSTRHAAVDSFGFGMTLFYMLTGRDPVPEEHRHSDWERRVYKLASDVRAPNWKSLPQRMARLILKATADRQVSRMDMSEIYGELTRLHGAMNDIDSVTSASLVAEEMAARSDMFRDYRWSDDAVSAEISYPSGLQMKITGDEPNGRIVLAIQWVQGGTEDRKKIGKWIKGTIEKIAEIAVSRKWQNVKKEERFGGFQVLADVDLDDVKGKMDLYAKSVDEIGANVRFE